MRGRGVVAGLTLLLGLAPAAGQGVERDRKPDSSGFLLPPVSDERPGARHRAPLPEPITRASADDYPDDLPPPTPRKRPAPREDDVAQEPPREPAARMARPKAERAVSDDDLAGAEQSAGRAARPRDVDLISYLTERPGRRPGPRDFDDEGDRPPHRAGSGWGDKVKGALGEPGDKWFCSDHAFDTFASPVTNPFLFEDPRSTTEIKPLFVYQSIPNGAPLLNGGNAGFLGVQGRLAFTDRLSLVIHKLGGQGLQPDGTSIYDGNTGLAELWLGPKYTFLRDTENGAVMAAGLQFQIPLGSSDVAQDTGSLSLVPYLSYAQNFLRSRAGSFNGILGTGYAFSTDNERSDYYYLSAHLDYDVMNRHRIYPMAELNWVYVTTNGGARPFPFEGRDLINFGGLAKNTGLLTGALGLRAKVTQSVSVGVAYELPFAGEKDLFRSRWTVDLIWRF